MKANGYVSLVCTCWHEYHPCVEGEVARAGAGGGVLLFLGGGEAHADVVVQVLAHVAPIW
jgi:hypothetical protein